MAGEYSAGWSARSYWIAQRLQERGEWASYLTAKELPWLTKALETAELWSEFISPGADQWRLRAQPSARAASTSPRREAGGESTNKRAYPHDDSDGDSNAGARGRGEKRARTGSQSSDDDVLSVLSGSDIDMAMWSGGASLASNAGTPEPAAGAVEAAERSLACATAAFRARSAIFEHYVAVVCNTGECSLCTDTAEARADVEQAERALNPARAAIGQDSEQTTGKAEPNGANGAQAVRASRHIEEDEDYDEDDEEETCGGSKPDTQDTNGAAGSMPDAQDASGAAGTKSNTQEISGAAGSMPDTHQTNGVAANKPGTQQTDTSDSADNPQRIVMREVFHTLDEIEDAAHEHMEHEAQERRVREAAEQRAAERKDMLAGRIGALQNMRNLAQFIDKHRDSVSMSTRELSSLLAEVRPKRSKWANERRVGQAELYEGLEHVLSELRGMGDAAAPFLSQVKRKEAPDYYRVIKRPMDLGAMAKNLRAEAYDSKRQFAEHLQLIRDNCYTYNTEPGNYYRRSADALLARANKLMERVPDVVVRDSDAHTECGDESGSEAQSGDALRAGSAGDDGTPALADGPALQGAAGGEPEPAAGPENNIARALAAGSLARRAVAELAAGHERGGGERLWRRRAGQRLREYLRRLGGGGAFGEQAAAARSGEGMGRFLAATHDSNSNNEPGNETQSEPGNEAQSEPGKCAWRFVAECELDAGVPQRERLEAQAARRGVLAWLDDDCERPTAERVPVAPAQALPPLDAYAAARFPDNAMWRTMAASVERLRGIRAIDAKIWAAKLDAPACAGAASDEPAPAPVRAYAVGAADPPARLRLDAHTAQRLVRRTGAFMLAHAGFDAATGAAVACLGEFVADFVRNLGRTLRAYADGHARTLSAEAMLAHALYANGAEHLGDLEYYARGEIARHANRLADLQRKLTRAYQDVVGDARADADAGELERGDAFVTGVVGGLGDLGDDFFGFKQLGLDKELGVEHLSVPLRLWRARGAESPPPPPADEVLPHALPPPWPPLAPDAHIGLLAAFLADKLAAGAVEDEALPPRQRFGAARPKAPPPNCLTHPRTHMHVGSGQAPAPERAKKWPSKTTAKKK
ncbi:Transcriptional activator spt7 [Coemansia sp. RSA 2704]|nr:Transcriptional activator spt7 [Coemansia sp. RSA 2704]